MSSFVLETFYDIITYNSKDNQSSIQDTDTFMALLDRVPASKVRHSLEENLALIDSRIQYLEELKAETKPSESEGAELKNDTNNNDDEYHAPLGQPIECFDNQG